MIIYSKVQYSSFIFPNSFKTNSLVANVKGHIDLFLLTINQPL